MWLQGILVVAALGAPQNKTSCTVRVSSAEQVRKNSALAFSAREIVDLEFEVTFASTPPGEHDLELQVLTPRGYLYQSLVVPFVQGSSGRDRKKSVRARLPVAGTSIVTSSLYGRWRVVPYVDASRASCAAPQGFTLTQ